MPEPEARLLYEGKKTRLRRERELRELQEEQREFFNTNGYVKLPACISVFERRRLGYSHRYPRISA